MGILISISDRVVSQIERFLDRIDDFWNPMVIKESRQALRSKAFLVMFMLTLVFSSAVTLFCIVNSTDGDTLFVPLLDELVIVVCLIVPFSNAWKLAREKEAKYFELLQITTMTPGKIVFGKMCHAVLEIVLYISAIAPFMIFSYFLGGVGIKVIFCTILCVFSLGMVLSAILITAASYTSEKITGRILLVFFNIWILEQLFFLIPHLNRALPDSISRVTSGLGLISFCFVTIVCLSGVVLFSLWLISHGRPPFRNKYLKGDKRVKVWVVLLFAMSFITFFLVTFDIFTAESIFLSKSLCLFLYSDLPVFCVSGQQ